MSHAHRNNVRLLSGLLQSSHTLLLCVHLLCECQGCTVWYSDMAHNVKVASFWVGMVIICSEIISDVS